jgi:hypothetical protein
VRLSQKRKFESLVGSIRPIEGETYDHPVSGSGMMVGLWQRCYKLAGATPPECWQQGQFRPDGHTVSVSDLYFVAHWLGVLDTSQGVVKMVDTDGIWTNRGKYMQATVLIKSLGFEIQEGNETMLGRSRITSSHFVAPGVFCVFEPHLNSGAQGSNTVEARTGGSGIPAFASYVHNVNFAADNISRYWTNPQVSNKLIASEVLPRARLNKIKSTEGGGVAELTLKSDEVNGPKYLHKYVESVVNDFQSAFTPEQYVANNEDQWNQLHAQLSAGRGTTKQMPYVFSDALSLLKVEAPGLLAKKDEPVAVAAPAAAGAAAASTAVAAGPTTAFGKELAGMAAKERSHHIGKVVLEIVHDLSGSKGASVDTPLMEAGVDSLAATELSNRLAQLTELTLPFTLLFEYPTSRAVSGYVLENSGVDDAAAKPVAQVTRAPVVAGDAAAKCVVVIANAVGQSPGALKTGERLAKMVHACGDAVGLVPLARWDLDKLVNDPVTQHTFYQRGFKDSGFNESQTLSVQYGGFLEATELWDCKFFGVASAEAACMVAHRACRRMRAPSSVLSGQTGHSSRIACQRSPRLHTAWATRPASHRDASRLLLGSMDRAAASTQRALLH